MVAGKQHRLDPKAVQSTDHICALFAQGVGEDEIAREHVVHSQIDDRAARLQRLLRRGRGRHANTVLIQQLGVACQHLFPLYAGAHAPAGAHIKVTGRRRLLPQFLFAAAHNRLAQRVFRQLLRGSSQPVERLATVIRRQADDIHHLRRAVSQGAGFVKRDDLHPGQTLQRVAFPHEKAVLCGIADGRHDRSGRGQHQRAGAEHHKDGHRPDDRTGDQPGERRRAQRDDHDPSGPAVGDPDDFGFARVGGLHQPDHALDRAVLPHLGGAHLKCPELIDRSAGDLVPHGFVHRQGFAGHHGLIDRGLAGDDHAIHRYALPGQDTEQVAHSHLFSGDDALLPIPQHTRGLRRQMHQFLDACSGFGDRQFLQQAAQLHDERHLAGGKILANGNRGDQRQRYQHIRLDVKGGHQTDDSLQNDGNAAENNGDPRHIKEKWPNAQ